MRLRKQLPDGVIAEKASPVSDRVARLVRKDGKLICQCPYLCDATGEVCEFGTDPDYWRTANCELG